MNISSSPCCAVGDADGLSEHDSPRDAFLALCTSVMVKNRFDKNKPFNNTLYPIVVFTGVEKYTGKGYEPYRNGEDQPYRYDSYGDVDYTGIKVGYASEFAEWLRKNNFGEVIEGPTVENKPNHPGHHVQVFIWVPNRDAMTEWYISNYRG